MKILLIFTPERLDTYNFLSSDKSNEYYILWDEKRGATPNVLPPFIKNEFFWDDYSTPYKLIEAIGPDRIIFCEIYDMREIPLCIVAKKKGVVTIYLDHGSGSFLEQSIVRYKKIHPKNLISKFDKFIGNIFSIIKRRYFYYASIGSVSGKNCFKFLTLPFYQFWYSSFEALHLNYISERTPHHFILYSRINYPDYDYHYHLKGKSILYSGLPNFDYFKNKTAEEKYLIYIDHPYFEEGMYGWDENHHRKIAFSLLNFAKANNTKIYIKLHPSSSMEIWRQYNLDEEHVELLQRGNYEEIYQNASLILGFSSSLLTGFLSIQKNVVLLGWHPVPEIKGFDFSSLNICHTSLSTDDLKDKYSYWCVNNEAKKNPEAYKKFIYDFNDPFDGHAAERIIKAITEFSTVNEKNRSN